MSPLLAVLGFAIGLLVGLIGVGGGSFLTPLLLAFGFKPLTAIASDLVYNSVTKLFGVLQHSRQRTIAWRTVGWLLIGSLPGILVALAVVAFHGRYSDLFLRRAIGIALVLVAISMAARGLGLLPKGRRLPAGVVTASGAPIGFLVGLTSIGSGSLTVIVLQLLDLSAARLVGSDIAHAFFLTSVGAVFYAANGHVNWSLVASLCIGSIPGVLIGSRLTVSAADRPLRLAIAFVLAVSGVKLISGAFASR